MGLYMFTPDSVESVKAVPSVAVKGLHTSLGRFGQVTSNMTAESGSGASPV